MIDRRPTVRMVRSFMYKHPRRDRGLASVMAILAPIALLLMVALVPLHVGSRAAIAAIGPLIVDGHVNSSAGIPVSGASVVVTISNGGTFRAAQSATSDVNGFYTVTFGNGDWDVGNTIDAAANYGSDYGLNSTVAIDTLEMTIDVKLGTVVGIPELGGPATTALTVSAIGMMVVFYSRTRRSCSP